MNRDNDSQASIVLAVIGIPLVIWLALLIAPSVKGGLPEILPKLLTVFNDPFHIELCEDSLKTVLVLLLAYAMGIGIYFSTQKNYRRREEHGSAKWGSAKAVDKKYRQSPPSENKLMTQNVRIGLNAKKHRRNLNTLSCAAVRAQARRGFTASRTLCSATHHSSFLTRKVRYCETRAGSLKKKDMRFESLTLSLWKRAIVTIPLFICNRITMCKSS